ncbi:cadherin domain-containing protein [Rhizobium sp.]
MSTQPLSLGDFTIDVSDTAFTGQTTPSVIALENGNFVATWRAAVVNGGAGNIGNIGQVFDATGAKVGDEFRVENIVAGNQVAAKLVAVDGGFFAVWYSNDIGNNEIRGRFFDLNGVAKADEFTINQSPTGSQLNPDVDVLPDGRIVVAWRTSGEGTIDSTDGGIQAVVLNADGTRPAGATDLLVNAAATWGVQDKPNVTALSDGYVISWVSTNQDGTYSVNASRFDMNGNVVGAPSLKINSTGTTFVNTTPAFAELGNGGLIALWNTYGSDTYSDGDGSGNAIRGRLFNANGTPNGSDFLINTTFKGAQDAPVIEQLADGRLFAVWTSRDADVGANIRGRLFEADGTPVGNDFVVNTGPIGSATSQTVAIDQLANGDVIVSYTSDIDGVRHILGTVVDIDGSSLNLAPTNVHLTATGVAENAATGTIIGILEATDPEGQPITYTLSDDAGGKFALITIGNSTRVIVNGTLDYETASSHDIKVIASDGVNQTEQTITINVADVPEVTYGITLPENAPEGTLVATFATPVGSDAGYVQFIGAVNGIDSSEYFNAVYDDAAGTWQIFTTAKSFDFESVNTSELSFYIVDYNTGAEIWMPITLDVTDVAEYVEPISLGDFAIDAADTTFKSQTEANVTALDNGNFVVVWRVATVDGNDVGLRGQIVNAQGQEIGAEFAVETTGTNTQSVPQLASLENGGFVAVWQSNDAGNNDIRGRVFDQNGTGASTDFVVNTTTTGSQERPEVTVLSDGRILVAWSSTGDGSTDNDGSIRAVFLNADGSLPAGTTDFQVNTVVTAGIQAKPSVTALSDGYIISWLSTENALQVVRATRYDLDGNVVGTPEIKVNTATTTFSNPPQYGELANGGFFATWQVSDRGGTVGTEIYAQVFDASGNPVGSEFALNSHTNGFQATPSMTSLDDGRLIAVWTSPSPTVTGQFEVRGRIIDTDGTPLGTEFKVHAGNYTGVTAPIVSQLANGDVVVTWTSTVNGAATVLTTIVDIDGSSATDNHAPEGLALTGGSVAENSLDGTVVGTLSATDADGDALTYSLTDDAGGKFKLVTENGVVKIVVNGALDYETADSHDISVKVVDGRGGEATQTFTIDVTDVVESGQNTAPTDLALSRTTILESQRTGATIGELTATDAEGDAITWSIVSGGDGNQFSIKTDAEGKVYLVQNGTLDHESGDGIYDVTVKASDPNGGETTKTFSITVQDDPFKLSAVPTGKDYTAIMENTPIGTKVGFVMQFDTSFVPATVTIANDPDGKFSVTTGLVGGQTYYFLTVNGELDYETDKLHEVTLKATDASGTSYEKTFQVHVLDAPEATDVGLEARGTITIDANTALATAGGGINWNTYLDEAFANVVAGLPAFMPSGTGWSPNTPSNQFVYTNTADGSMISLNGSNLVYNWSDPISGEDAHVVSGVTNTLVFGTGNVNTFVLNNPELTISGLDLSNDSSLMNRIWGETQLFAQAWMYGANGSTPADIEYVKAILQTYAQNFKGSAGNDTYTGTLFNDTIAGNGGNDFFDGNDGDDTITFTGVKSGYTIAHQADGTVKITDTATGSVTTVKNIETAQFSDQTVDLTQPEQPAENLAPVINIDGPLLFTPGQVDIPRYGNYATAFAEDMDGDGDLDIVVVDKSGDKLDWYANDGQGNISGTATSMPIGTYGYSVRFADIDGDGKKDLLLSSNGNGVEDTTAGKVEWFKGNGDGTFGDAQQVVGGILNAFETIAVDFDNDGDLDLVTVGANENQRVILSTNNGDGTFTNTDLAIGAVNAQTIRVADINGDGKLDVVATDPNSGKVAWFAGNGDGTFGAANQVGGLQWNGRVDAVIADVDGDGDMDIVTTESESADWPMPISWFENDGSGNFIEHRTSMTGDPEASVFLADIDGNGTLDIIRGGQSGGKAADVAYGFKSLAVDENKASGLSGISFTDATTGASVTVTLTAASGTLNAASGSGVTVAGNGTGTITLTGSIASINAFLAADKATFTTAFNDESDVKLTVSINDGTDNGGKSASTTILLDVQPFEGEPPVDLALDNASVNENSEVGTLVGQLSATDPEGGALTYTLTNDAGGKFAIATDGNGNYNIVVNGALDHEAAENHTITVVVKDVDGNETTKDFVIAVGDVDEAPTNVALSDTTVSEDAAVGTVVGTLSAIDPEAAGAITFALENDAGGLFEIVGNEIRVKAGLDFETATKHEIVVKATDATGQQTIQTIEIAVGNVDEGNEQPAMITIDATGSASMNFEAYIRGGFEADTVGGGFPVFDNSGLFEGEEMFIGYGSEASSKYVLMHGDLEYAFGTHTVAGTANTIEYGTKGTGSYDANGYFIGGNVELRITGLDLSNPVPANSTEEQQIEANGAIHNFAIAHMYGAPTANTQPRYDKYADALDAYAQNYMGSSGTDIYAGTQFNDIIAGNAGDDMLAGGGGNDTIDGGSGIDTAIYTGNKSDYTFTFNTNGTWTVVDNRVGSINDGTDTLKDIEYAKFGDQTVLLEDLLPPNTAPTNLQLSENRVDENVAIGTVIGILSADDAEGNALTYSLTDDAGGKFAIVTEGGVTRLVVKGSLDYEAAASHNVTVKVSDGRAETSQTFTIGINDLDEDNNAPVGLTLTGRTVAETATAGTVVGTFSATDPDGDKLSYELTNDANGRFALLTSGTGANMVYRLVVIGALDYETATSHQIELKVSDGKGGETVQSFDIQVTDVLEGNDQAIHLSKSVIAEDAYYGDVVGRLSLGDTASDDVTWSLSGSNKFALETNANGVTRIVVNGKLDYETRSSYSLTLTANDGEDTYEQVVTIDVSDVAEVIRGDAGNNVLRGDATADILRGGRGDDRLIGGGGADKLIGGQGADTFVFGSVNHSKPGAYDVIKDFRPGQGDRIDVSGIDAIRGTDRNDAFDFIGKADFSGTAGELRFEKVGNRTIVQADVDGDGNADFLVHLLGRVNLQEDSFIL